MGNQAALLAALADVINLLLRRIHQYAGFNPGSMASSMISRETDVREPDVVFFLDNPRVMGDVGDGGNIWAILSRYALPSSPGEKPLGFSDSRTVTKSMVLDSIILTLITR